MLLRTLERIKTNAVISVFVVDQITYGILQVARYIIIVRNLSMANVSLIFNGTCKICNKPLSKGPVFDLNVQENYIEIVYGAEKVLVNDHLLTTFCRECFAALKKLLDLPNRELIIYGNFGK